MFKHNAFSIGMLAGTACAIALQIVPAIAQNSTPTNSLIPPSTLDSAGGGIFVDNCMVRFINKTRVPAETQGKLTELLVEEGMSIKKGDKIAVVDAKQAELALKLKRAEEEIAKLNAQNDVNKRDAVATEKIARNEAKAWVDLHDKGAAPYWETRKKVAEAERSLLRIELADLNEDVAQAEFAAKQIGSELAEYEIEMRTVRAEFDAFVERRIAQLGEWVQPGSPIVELVQMDRVRVEGNIDALNYAGQVHKGAPVEVSVIVGGTYDEPIMRTYNGVIEYVSTELDLNKRHRIWVSIENERVGDEWLLKPGMAAKMRIGAASR